MAIIGMAPQKPVEVQRMARMLGCPRRLLLMWIKFRQGWPALAAVFSTRNMLRNAERCRSADASGQRPLTGARGPLLTASASEARYRALSISVMT